MIRHDQAYWERLRKDARSAFVVGFAVLACLMAVLCILGILFPGPHSRDKTNPLYWLCLLPFAWWAAGLIAYEPRPVRTLRPALALSAAASIGSMAVALLLGRDLAPWLVCGPVALVAALASELAYRDSLLYKEGPAR